MCYDLRSKIEFGIWWPLMGFYGKWEKKVDVDVPNCYIQLLKTSTSRTLSGQPLIRRCSHASLTDMTASGPWTWRTGAHLAWIVLEGRISILTKSGYRCHVLPVSVMSFVISLEEDEQEQAQANLTPVNMRHSRAQIKGLWLDPEEEKADVYMYRTNHGHWDGQEWMDPVAGPCRSYLKRLLCKNVGLFKGPWSFGVWLCCVLWLLVLWSQEKWTHIMIVDGDFMSKM